MIHVRKVGTDLFRIQPLIPGASVPAKDLHRARVPDGLMGAIVHLQLVRGTEHVPEIGRRVSDEEWILEDGCLTYWVHGDEV